MVGSWWRCSVNPVFMLSVCVRKIDHAQVWMSLIFFCASAHCWFFLAHPVMILFNKIAVCAHSSVPVVTAFLQKQNCTPPSNNVVRSRASLHCTHLLWPFAAVLYFKIVLIEQSNQSPTITFIVFLWQLTVSVIVEVPFSLSFGTFADLNWI